MADYYVTRKSNGDVYNVYPSALNSEELRIDFPEIKVTAPKKYQEYHSPYTPIKNLENLFDTLESQKSLENPFGSKSWRKLFYKSITPQDYNIPKVVKQLGKGFFGFYRPTDNNGNYTDVDNAADQQWAIYTRQPIKGDSLFESTNLRPTQGTATYRNVMKYKYPEKIFNEEDIQKLLDKEARGEKPSMVVTGDGKGMGSYTLSLGRDKDGRKYASYYDDWDLNIFKGVNGSNVFDRLFINGPQIIPWVYLKDKISKIGDMGKAIGLKPQLTTYYDRKYLDELKKGGEIHIKKKNRGKFTDYCGGKVTDDCIRRGKNSSNPITRKRATFADNARHFKH